MRVTPDGVAVEDLVAAVKKAVKLAGLSTTDTGRDLRVTAIQLSLATVASVTGGGKLEFTLPFLGMKVRFGRSITGKDTHNLDITLVPPDLVHEVRDGDVEEVLVDAIETIRAVVARAVEGEDPFVLKESTVELSFVITEERSVSLGYFGEETDEVTHKLKLTLGTNS